MPNPVGDRNSEVPLYNIDAVILIAFSFCLKGYEDIKVFIAEGPTKQCAWMSYDIVSKMNFI